MKLCLQSHSFCRGVDGQQQRVVERQEGEGKDGGEMRGMVLTYFEI